MKFRRLASMISTTNHYTMLKWPSLLNSILLTIVAFLFLLSFSSDDWFIYQTYDIEQNSTETDIVLKAPVTGYNRFGLWSICIDKYNNKTMKCSTWIRETRPPSFNVITVLVTASTLLANLAIFPSWALTILILYNVKNTYIRFIVVFLWIIFCFMLLIACLSVCAMILVALTKYYSPGKFMQGTRCTLFHNGPGLFYMPTATILSLVCLIIIVTTLIWQKFIEMRLVDEERELYRQLNDDNYTPNWKNKVVRVRRGRSTTDDEHDEPPPYNPFYDRS